MILPRERARFGPARILVLGCFLPGYFAVNHSFGGASPSFILLTLLNMAACALLLSRLTGPLRDTLWVWVSLVIILDGYFLRPAWFIWKFNSPGYVNQYYPEIRWVTPARILDGYPWITLGFVSFCVAVCAALLLFSSKRTPTEEPGRTHALRPATALHVAVVTFLVYVFSAFVQLSLGYGVLGAPRPSLPLGIGSALTLFQRHLGPALMLLCIWVLDRTRPELANFVVGLQAVWALIEGLISTSRGGILLFLTPIFFLFLFTGRLTRKRKAATVVALLCTFALLPYLSTLRNERVGLSTTPAKPTLSVDDVVESAFFVVSRIGAGGSDGVWWSLDHVGPPSLSRVVSFMRPGALTHYYTNSVVRVSLANDYRSAGMFASAMIAAGGLGVLVLLSVQFLLIGRAWSLLQSLSSAPVALSISGFWIAAFVASGAFEFLFFVKVGIALVVAEMVYRKLLRAPLPSRRITAVAPRPPHLLAGARSDP